MTDPILPDDLANGLIDGTADISSLPTELRGVAGLFSAAHQPATDAELAGMAAAMEQFAVAVSGTATSAAAASSSGVISMFGTRITKRAAVMVACTLLAAGTAAAASNSGSHLMFSGASFDDVTSSSVEASSESTETSLDGTQTSLDSSGPDETVDPSVAAADFPLCVAASDTSSSPPSSSDPADDQLSHDAAANGKSVDDFCAEVQAAHDADDDNGIDVTGSSIDDHGSDSSNDSGSGSSDDNSTGSSIDTSSGKGGTGGQGSDDPATSVATSNSVNDSVTTSSDVSGKNSGKGGSDTTSTPKP